MRPTLLDVTELSDGATEDPGVEAEPTGMTEPEAVVEAVDVVETVESAAIDSMSSSPEHDSAVETAAPSIGDTAPSIGDTAPSIGDTAPSIGDTAPSIGDTAPSIGDTASSVPPPGTTPAGAKADTGDSGKIVGGLISAVSADEVVLKLDDGRPAVINCRNIDEAGSDPTTIFNVGDRAEGAILAREDPQQRVVLSRSWALKKQAWDKIVAVAEAHEPLTAKVTGISKRGLVVDVGVRGFVPSSHLSLEPTTDLSSFKDQTIQLKVLELDIAKERLVLSRRSLLLKEQRKEVHDLLTGLTVGEERQGTVASLVDYGAFVDLGGVTGLVHLSELSWQRVGHPKHALSVGDEVSVKVLDVKVKKRRVSLSIRQLSEDPFAAVPVGEVVTGPVTRLVDFGAFVDVGGVEGLVHLSEMSEYRVSAPEEVVTPGEEIRVKVLSVDRKRRRIELSIRQAVSSEYG